MLYKSSFVVRRADTSLVQNDSAGNANKPSSVNFQFGYVLVPKVQQAGYPVLTRIHGVGQANCSFSGCLARPVLDNLIDVPSGVKHRVPNGIGRRG